MKTNFLKTTIINFLLLGFIASSTACASTDSQYYRVWQGFTKVGLSHQQFIADLPQFMQDTVDLYKEKALNQYLVAIPPKHKPSYIPDEFALVGLFSEVAYKEIRKTPEGQKYSDRHWDLFNKENSKSAPFHKFDEEQVKQLENNNAYDMFGKALDWQKGHSVFYIGLRNKALDKKDFMKGLYKHLKNMKTRMAPRGLQGYIVIANENYEVAYLNWESKEHLEAAFQSADGEALIQESAKILTNLQYQTTNDFMSFGDVKVESFIKTIY